MRALAWAMVFWILAIVAGLLHWLFDTPHAGWVMALMLTLLALIIGSRRGDDE
jgi:hypothetical protein